MFSRTTHVKKSSPVEIGNSDNCYNPLYDGIKSFLTGSKDYLKEMKGDKPKKTHLLSLHHEWYFTSLMEKCSNMKNKLSEVLENEFKISVLLTIEKYLQKSGKKTPYYRLVNVNEILDKANLILDDAEFKKELSTYLPKIQNGRLPISNLRYAIYDCIQEYDKKEYYSTRAAAPAA